MGPKRWDWRDLKPTEQMPTQARKKKKINFKMPSACPGGITGGSRGLCSWSWARGGRLDLLCRHPRSHLLILGLVFKGRTRR